MEIVKNRDFTKSLPDTEVEIIIWLTIVRLGAFSSSLAQVIRFKSFMYIAWFDQTSSLV